jgi:hypothetical protein
MPYSNFSIISDLHISNTNRCAGKKWSEAVIKVDYTGKNRESYLFLAACHPVTSTGSSWGFQGKQQPDMDWKRKILA